MRGPGPPKTIVIIRPVYIEGEMYFEIGFTNRKGKIVYRRKVKGIQFSLDGSRYEWEPIE